VIIEGGVSPVAIKESVWIEIKLDRLIDDMRLLRSQMIAFDRQLKGVEASQTKRAERPTAREQIETIVRGGCYCDGKDCFDFLCSRGSNRRSLAWERETRTTGLIVPAIAGCRNQRMRCVKCSGALLPPPPPAEKAGARKDEARSKFGYHGYRR